MRVLPVSPCISVDCIVCPHSRSSLKEGDLMATSALGPVAYFIDVRVFVGGMVLLSLVLEVVWSNKPLKSVLWSCTKSLMLICTL